MAFTASGAGSDSTPAGVGSASAALVSSTTVTTVTADVAIVPLATARKRRRVSTVGEDALTPRQEFSVPGGIEAKAARSQLGVGDALCVYCGPAEVQYYWINPIIMSYCKNSGVLGEAPSTYIEGFSEKILSYDSFSSRYGYPHAIRVPSDFKYQLIKVADDAYMFRKNAESAREKQIILLRRIEAHLVYKWFCFQETTRAHLWFTLILDPSVVAMNAKELKIFEDLLIFSLFEHIPSQIKFLSAEIFSALKAKEAAARPISVPGRSVAKKPSGYFAGRTVSEEKNDGAYVSGSAPAVAAGAGAGAGTGLAFAAHTAHDGVDYFAPR
jgi:hypothetical protein